MALGFVDFLDYFDRFSILFAEGHIRKWILPLQKEKSTEP